MRQLMGNQSPTLMRPRREPTCTEHNVMSHGVGISVHRPHRSLGDRVGMHPHPAEVVAESRLHEGSGSCIEGLAGCSQYFVDDGWCCNLSRVAWLDDALGLQTLLLLAWLGRLTLGMRSSARAL